MALGAAQLWLATVISIAHKIAVPWLRQVLEYACSLPLLQHPSQIVRSSTNRSPAIKFLFIRHIIVNHHPPLALIHDLLFPGNHIIRNDCFTNPSRQLYLRFLFLELTAANQNSSALRLYRRSTFFLMVPLHERAIAEPNGSFPCNLCDLIAWSPKRAIHKTHAAPIALLHAHHRRVRA